MPEMPEVESLARFLTEKCVGHAIARIDLAAFSALKTYDPPLLALHGLEIESVTRRGKFIDISAQGLHLVFHLARAGWLRWKDAQPDAPARPGKGPLALRVQLDDGSGFDLTEAGTQRKLAVYVVADPSSIPMVATLGPGPAGRRLRPGGAGRRCWPGGPVAAQGCAEGPADHRRHRQRLLRRDPARRPAEPVQAGQLPRPTTELSVLYGAIQDELTGAIQRAEGLAAKDLKGEKKSGLRVHGRKGEPCDVCGDTIAEVSFADSSLQYCPTCQTGGKKLADRRLSKLLK